MSQYKVTVVPHTHWDREWYQPFSVFQARLVETVDEILDLLEGRPDFTHFMLDGQAVVLEDYLAVKPWARERLVSLIDSGKLAIGPWYTLADEFLASPEALVRNLLIGIQECGRFGEPMSVVYTPDSFGHISQLPRIAAGFGFDSLVFERGVGDEGEELGSEFRWFSADGEHSVLAVHLITTYSSAAGIGYADWTRYAGYESERAVAHARKAIFGSDERIGMEAWLDESLARIEGGASAYATGSNLLLLNGSDHLRPQTDLPAVLEDLAAGIPEVSFSLAPLREYIDGVLEEKPELRSYRGEFRGSRYHHVLSGVFSARTYLKQANHRSQQWLERYAEPLAVMAYVEGAPYPESVLRHNWKELLKNHAHDSICGCSIDEVHEEMLPRFDGVESAAKTLSRKSIAFLGGGFWEVAPPPVAGDRLTPPVGGENPVLTVFNPHPHRWRGVIEAKVPVPEGFSSEVLRRSDGRIERARIELTDVPAAGFADVTERVAKVRWLGRLEPLSLTSFALHERSGEDGRPGTSEEPQADFSDAPDPVRLGEASLENELIRLDWSNGRLSLVDLACGAKVAVKLYLEDSGDAGDEYDFSPVPGDPPLRRELDFDRAQAGCDGLVGELKLAGSMTIPEELAGDRRSREGEAELAVTVTLRLEASEPFARLALQVGNSSKDHRLRLVAECDVEAQTLFAEGHFDVLERSVETPAKDHWFQKPSGSNHQRRFLAVEDGRHGLALFNAGLPEYASEPAEGGTRLAVTLLRAVGWLSRNDLLSRPEGAGPALPTPGAQCLGDHEFELGLMPYPGRWDEANVPQAADRFTTPPLVEASPEPEESDPFLQLPDGLLLSALKKADAGESVVLRVWNPGRSRVGGTLLLGREPVAAHRADLDERPRESLGPTTRIPLSLAPKELTTLLLRFGGGRMT